MQLLLLLSLLLVRVLVLRMVFVLRVLQLCLLLLVGLNAWPFVCLRPHRPFIRLRLPLFLRSLLALLKLLLVKSAVLLLRQRCSLFLFRHIVLRS